jgi:hypothetical protein
VKKTMATPRTPAPPPPDPTKRNGRDVFRTPGAPDSPPPDTGRPTTEDPPPMRSVHTSNFSAILQELGISVLVTTYQAGKLVLRPRRGPPQHGQQLEILTLREARGGKKTHFLLSTDGPRANVLRGSGGRQVPSWSPPSVSVKSRRPSAPRDQRDFHDRCCEPSDAAPCSPWFFLLTWKRFS